MWTLILIDQGADSSVHQDRMVKVLQHASTKKAVKHVQSVIFVLTLVLLIQLSVHSEIIANHLQKVKVSFMRDHAHRVPMEIVLD